MAGYANWKSSQIRSGGTNSG